MVLVWRDRQMRTLLVITTGRTDVQLVLEGLRVELDGRQCGRLHDEIEKRKWSVVDAPVRKAERPVSELPPGELRLCTPKLDAVLRYLRDCPPAKVLILETRRDFDSDPRLAGRVVEQRLRDRGIKCVKRYAFLRGREALEDPGDEADAIVRTAVVSSLSRVIADTCEEVSPENVVVATTGGIASANSVIAELARLHAAVCESEVSVLEVPDGAISDQADRAVEERFDPARGIRARWLALSLIREGNLLAASGITRDVEREPGQEWTKVVKWLAAFAASLPIPDECDINVLKDPRRAVRAALRVELALRAGDIPRAVHGTVSFFECVLWDHLDRSFTDTKKKYRGRKVLSLKDGAPAPEAKKQEKLVRDENVDEQENKRRPFEQLEDGSYVFFEEGAGRFAKYYVESCKLHKLTKKIDGVKELRNDVAHAEPTPELMKEARSRMVASGLWSPAGRFLEQEIVQGVLCELGVEAPESLCERLLKTVSERVRIGLQ